MTPATEALVAQAEKYVAAAKPNFAANGFISGLIGIVREQAREIERLKKFTGRGNDTTHLVNP